MRATSFPGTGWIDWTRVMYRHEDSGEGGMAVYAVLPEDDKIPESFVACLPGTSVSMYQPDAMVTTAHRTLWPRQKTTCCHVVSDGGLCEKQIQDPESVDLLMALCLGGSGGSWWSESNGYFDCQVEDLTPEGQALLGDLTRLYGRSPLLITLLDT